MSEIPPTPNPYPYPTPPSPQPTPSSPVLWPELLVIAIVGVVLVLTYLAIRKRKHS
jgi:hypothetical protein